MIGFSMSRRLLVPTSVLLICFTALFWRSRSRLSEQPSTALVENTMNEEAWGFLSEDELAPRVLPRQIMAQPLASGGDLLNVPKLIHQSWMDSDLPPRMKRWSQTCRSVHRDWQWSLWSDTDNLNMVETFFPWLLETYRSLPAEITRADASRNMYMYLFGGVYADLDVECLRPFDELTQNRHLTGSQVAIFGRMGYDGTDNTLDHTVPNAWMAATPGHPFFLLALERLKESTEGFGRSWFWGTSAEKLTGPVALYNNIEKYEALLAEGTLIRRLEQNPSYGLFDRPSTELRMDILPPEYIYPYAWNNQGVAYRGTCWAGSGDFNSRKCKEACTTNQSYAITYWSHSWSTDLRKAHDQNQMEALRKSMDNK